MKTFVLIAFLSLPLLSFSQQEYVKSSFLTEGPKAPNTHYIGEAWLNNVLQGDAEFNFNITKATFRNNSTLDWHKHATPQVLIVVDGEGYYQERGKDAIIIKKGDVIKCTKETEHWHTASKEKSVTCLAIYDGTKPTTWTEKLTQEYYDSVAKKLQQQ